MIWLILISADTLGPWSQVQAKYNKVFSLSASFIESITYSEGYSERYAGRLYIERPDKVRLEAYEPDTQLIVSDGKIAWLYLPKSKSAMRQPVSEVSKACDPRLFLLERPPGFRVSYQLRDSAHIYTFIPPSGDVYPYQKVMVELGPGLDIRVVSVVDPLGNLYAFALRDIVLNPGLNPELFRFTPPEGTEIFGQ
ncbi:MAG: outer membrane lipoprotein chaperone LolA [candidate division WOR-3 bacterium]